jgi:hypothetical protein
MGLVVYERGNSGRMGVGQKVAGNCNLWLDRRSEQIGCLGVGLVVVWEWDQ